MISARVKYFMRRFYSPEQSPYLKQGRLPEVLAALQITAEGERPEKEITGWARELSPTHADHEIVLWTSVFREHPEFFVIYTLPGQTILKAALRWRYTNKLYDAKQGKYLTPQEKDALSPEERGLLTTEPLKTDAVEILINTAIELHTRAIAERRERRWWIPIFAAVLGFVGALLGAHLGE